MKTLGRVFVTLVAAYVVWQATGWLGFLIAGLASRYIPLESSAAEWLGAMLFSAIGGAVTARYTWKKTAPAAPGGESSGMFASIALGSLIVGVISFSAGFFGPMILAPDANQGPMLGIFITGPIGFLVGAIGGFVYWYRSPPARS